MAEPMDLAYEERGSGPVLLFVHGFPLNRTMWISQLAGLAKIRTCVAVDLRGHGLSRDRKPRAYSIDLFADDVAATMDAMNVETADLCGLSMGGYVLFSFWRRHRQRLRSLVFCDTRAEADTDEAKAGREKAARMVRERGMEAFYEQLGPRLVAPSASDEVRARVRDMFLSIDPAVAAADSLAMRDRADMTGELGSIDVPVLWLHGDQDQIMPIEAARAAAGTIPGARFEALPSAGHMGPMEAPEPASAAITSFLGG